LPQYEVVIADSLTLKINLDGKEKYQLNLDRISAYCAENKDGCDSVVQGFLDRSIKMLNTPEFAVTAEKLRVVVRPKDFIAQVKETTKGDPSVSPLFEPYLDLDMVCEFDTPTATKLVLSTDLSALKLTAIDAIARAKANMHSALTPVAAQARDIRPGEFGALMADTGYTSSWLLFPDGWKDLAARFDNHLLVAVPADNLVLYERDDGDASAATLRSTASDEYQHGERPISKSIYRWHETGWEIVAGK